MTHPSDIAPWVTHNADYGWMSRINSVIFARVADHGLCQPRESATAIAVANLVNRFEDTVAVKVSTRYKYKQVADSLREFLGAETPLESITGVHANNWRRSIVEATPDSTNKSTPSKILDRATVAKRVVIAKGMFGIAVRWGFLATNPFAHLKAGSQSNLEWAFYVNIETIRAILTA